MGNEEGGPSICVGGSLYLCVGDEEGDPCICVWGMRKGVPVSVCGE